MARPPWLVVRAPSGERASRTVETLRRLRLATVCREARCPNAGECWGEGTATVLLLGHVCTRDCRFCAVSPGTPVSPDPTEPDRVAQAAAELGWRHLVATSVTRDDLPDGGAGQFARTVAAVRERSPGTAVELLVPDFEGRPEPLRDVVDARPDVLGHNVETVPRLYPRVRPKASYERSLGLLARARELDPALTVKSGLMVGLGETLAETVSVFRDLFAAGCRSLTVGQYLAPTRDHVAVERYVEPAEFSELEAAAREIGFGRVRCGPLVRSSYRAAEGGGR